MKLSSLQQNTKELRLRPSKRNLLDGAISPKENTAQPEQSSNDTVTERKSSARIITNLVSPKSPSNPAIVVEPPPAERVELVVVEKEDEQDEVLRIDILVPVINTSHRIPSPLWHCQSIVHQITCTALLW